MKLLPVGTMPNWRRRYDRHSQRLFLSERLSPFDQLREVAMEACLIRMRSRSRPRSRRLNLSSDEARRLARFELGRYAAHALMMPYAGVPSGCRPRALRHRRAASRFGVSFEQAANRLTMLQRPGSAGVPFFMLEVDNAGNRFRRAGAQGFPHSRFRRRLSEAAGPRRLRPARPDFRRGRSKCPTAPSSCCIARTLEGPQGAFNERPRRTALLLGCDIGFRDEIVYGAALPGGCRRPPRAGQADAVGPACRLCERVGCLARAEPPVTRPLGLDEMVTGLSAFDFQ